MYKVEPFQPSDLIPVMRLASRVLPEQYPVEFYLQLARNHGPLFKVVREIGSGQLLGFIVAARQPGLRSNVLLFGVDPAHQGRGIGRSLLRSVQRSLTLSNVRELDLEVRPDNVRAIDFYRREGFAVTGLESKVYKDGSDALHMSKPLL